MTALREAVKNLIRYHEFDIVGTQEGLIDQLDDLAEMKEFAYLGAGRRQVSRLCLRRSVSMRITARPKCGVASSNAMN